MRRDESAMAEPSAMVVIVAGGLILAVALGIRQSFGLFLPAMTEARGWGRETFSLAIAIQNLTWGVAQPFFGMVADRFGAGRVLVVGTLAYASGLALMPLAMSMPALTASAGVLIGLGLGGTGFGVVYGVIGRRLPSARQSTALGLAGALGSVGQFVMLPVAQHLIGALGWAASLTVLAVTSGMMAPLAFVLTRRGTSPGIARVAAAEVSLGGALAAAARHRGFWLLNLGFVVCGFQLAFITNHLPAFLGDHGLSSRTAMTALAVVGVTNIVGSWLCGVLGGRLRAKHVLSGLYLVRTVATVVYVVAPITPGSTMVFAVVMGLTWLGTVPLTTGVVSGIFGVQYLATLFGFVFLGHQLGGFLGVWLAGALFDATHSYQIVWLISIALGLFSTIVHLPIDDRAVALRGAVAPAIRA
jgi:MFS family permease